MVDHWERNGPPVYIAVAGYLGLIKAKSKKPSKGEIGNLEDLARSLQSTGGVLHG